MTDTLTIPDAAEVRAPWGAFARAAGNAGRAKAMIARNREGSSHVH